MKAERKIKRIEYSEKFLKSLRKLPKNLIEKAYEKEKIFRENPFNPILKTHKLHGKDKECLAFWIDYKYRIKFIFLSENEVLFLDIGPHNIYK
jgi:mRNA-degrading endonuclease YafQ of YafQ-DinJ toxin-antitoxin module